ncbi:MAG: ribonuclease H family protein [Tannerellaceae bacterium]|jgi:ribonuclease HI|nr:ribonuclease H family protein [Tannerellaceae bacterium]
MPGPKYYVVWKGLNPGIYDSWDACRLQVEGQRGARYKSFASRSEALEAFEKGHEAYLGKSHNPWHKAAAPAPHAAGRGGLPVKESLAVDAACSGNPGDMEYRGVYTATGEEIFHIGPLKQGTNNVGEFLALVHGLALLKQKNSSLPVYSDSVNAIKWVKEKKCRTLLKRSEVNRPVFDLIDRALKWLGENDWDTPVLKWETSLWGEIPADFGRK